MPQTASNAYHNFPSFNISKAQDSASQRLQNEHFSDDELDIFNSSGNMAGTGSPPPFIKDEPDEQQYNPHRFMSNQQGFSIPQHNQGQQFGHQFMGAQGGNAGSIDPSELTMPGNHLNVQGGGFSQFPFGSQTNMSSSFNLGNSGIADEELLDLGNLDSPQTNNTGFHDNQPGFSGHDDNRSSSGAQNIFGRGQDGMSMGHQGQMNQVFSETPDGAPIQSPFIHGFNYDQFRNMHFQPQNFVQPMQTPSSYNASPHTHPNIEELRGEMFEGGYMPAKPQPRPFHGLERKGSDSRSPMTPKTPALGALNLGTPESGSFPSHSLINSHLAHRHKNSLSTQWDAIGSAPSYVDSPLSSSPPMVPHHAQISDVLRSGERVHHSLPTKVENGPIPGFQTQEAKRRRRRESHNMVERRRRDNINERIQELSHLVPQHRLEDEKVRKHLINNSPLSPPVGATGISPPNATSLLAGGNGKRAAGSISQGIPLEEKDKGPNKGDILNGAVSWTRDLMWAMYVKLQQEGELLDYISSLGGSYPFEPTEEEKRMRTELIDAVEKNDPRSFSYSRGPGSGLRVPKHTNIAGDAINASALSPQSLSPANQSGGSGTNSAGQGQGQQQQHQQPQQQFWNGQEANNSHGSLNFKEEDEYGMEMC
ncbi:hypothetical protein L228DRAFT_251670 [Xylona heveae TC161]|uniref:BHLH domain-containing protein n=1 Tax=Xylona heveae (strain CBS 132557 / TC161) TaxID=1328760 RepID=A0A164Z8R8_XYLHT|nr:hypothetical protein L228DRAFT_251670 [Xylona heveae TC161]KZF18823.1 hypothetical protein L228DRAFT_251670 [Xylona heveae TC161]